MQRTRMGRFVNKMRRNNAGANDVTKKARKLIKHWQDVAKQMMTPANNDEKEVIVYTCL